MFSSAEAEARVHERPHDWQAERAGSLTSLNAIGAGVAARMIEEFVEGTLTDNATWWRLELQNARLAVTRLQSAANDHCLCPLAGLGDDGKERLSDWVRLARVRHTTGLPTRPAYEEQGGE